MQAVPYTAFTTKSGQQGNSVNSPHNSRYGTRNQKPVGHPAFTETFHRATEDVSKRTTGARLRGHAMQDRGDIRSEGMGSRTGNISVQTATPGSKTADTPITETAGKVLQQLLEILQMLGLAGESEVTSDLPQTPAQAEPLKALPGQNQNLNETLGQLQKDLQRLMQQLRQLIEHGVAQADARIFMAGNDLWKTFNLAGSDVLSNREFLTRLAEELGKIVNARTTAGNMMAGNPAGDYLYTFKAGAGEVSSQNGEGGGTAGTPAGQGTPLTVDVVANDPKQSDSKLINQAESRQVGINQTRVKPAEAQQSALKQSEVKPTEVKQAEVKQSDIKQSNVKQTDVEPTEVKQADVKQTDVKQTDVKQTDVKQTDVKQTDVKQTDVKQTDVKQTYVKQTDVKQTDVKQTDVKQTEVKHPEWVSVNRLFGLKGANSAPADSGQSGLGLQDQNNPLPQAYPEHSQVQNFKLPEQPVNIPRMAQVIFGQITHKAKLLVTPGATEMQIQLKPDYLGKMNLSITTENGLVTAKFNTESYRVKEVIEANLNTLKDSLAQQGVKVDQLVVNVSTERDYSGHQEQNNLYHQNNSGRRSKTGGNLKEEEFARLFPADLESKSIQAYYGNTVDFKA